MSKRWVFVVSPGRCGTGYLARVLHCLPRVAAYHEPDPRFHEANDAAQFDYDFARDFWRLQKVPAIERLAINKAIYVETSHLFVNAWGKVPAVLDQYIDLVMLTRPHREVALSYWRRGSIPGKTRRGRDFLIHPGGPCNALPPHGEWRNWHGYQLCYWHCLEVEERARHLGLIYAVRKARVHHTSLEEMTTRDGFAWLVEDLELGEPDWTLWRALNGAVVNQNPHSYADKMPGRDLGEMEREVEAWARV